MNDLVTMGKRKVCVCIVDRAWTKFLTLWIVYAIYVYEIIINCKRGCIDPYLLK
jgi:hypothetical protein